MLAPDFASGRQLHGQLGFNHQILEIRAQRYRCGLVQLDLPPNQFIHCDMSPLIEAHRDELAVACREFQVDRLEAFGSVVRDNFDPARSDLDLIVSFRAPGEPGYADRYLGLAERLERIFARPVDLLTERSIRNPIFRRSIQPERVVIYGS